MNSKEALQIIRSYHNEMIYNSDYAYIEIENIFKQELDIIEQDLEVLEILKTEIFNEHCFDLDAGWYDDSFSLNENQIKVIKEWLDNE